jgi:hypothetical protein
MNWTPTNSTSMPMPKTRNAFLKRGFIMQKSKKFSEKYQCNSLLSGEHRTFRRTISGRKFNEQL